MSSNIHMILGPMTSGKSALAEHILREIRTVYIATLPNLPQYKPRITRHQAQRPKNWPVVEIQESVTEMSECLRYRNHCDALLLDGLSALCFRYGHAMSAFQRLSRSTLAETQKRIIRLLDELIDGFPKVVVVATVYPCHQVCGIGLTRGDDFSLRLQESLLTYLSARGARVTCTPITGDSQC